MSDLVQQLRDPDSLLAELMARLGTDDPLFDAFREAMPDKYWARYDLSAVRLGYEFARLEIERLTAELETERMRLAACGVIAMCNTPESAAQQRQMRPEYWCASVQDVANAVDREMALRDEVEALRRFKVYVHRRLDEASIPTHPGGPHSAEGCRVGDRLDIALGSRAARDVLAERQRQISAEGWTPEHDDQHDVEELALAATCYALPDHARFIGSSPFRGTLPTFWPWGGSYWRPGDRRRDLVKAGALILAEIERLDRAAAMKEASNG